MVVKRFVSINIFEGEGPPLIIIQPRDESINTMDITFHKSI